MRPTLPDSQAAPAHRRTDSALPYFRVSIYQRIRYLCNPLIFALFIIGTCHFKHLVRVAKILHKFLGIFARRQFIQMNRVCIVPAHVFLIDCLDIVLQRPVILPGIPNLFQLLRQPDHGGNLRGGITFVDIQEGLIVDELIDGSCVGQVFVDSFLAPMRPVVRLKTTSASGNSDCASVM